MITPRALLLPAGLSVFLLSGCAAPTGVPDLEARARAESQRSVSAASLRGIPLPPGLSAELIGPIDDPATGARRSYAEIRAAMTFPERPAVTDPEPDAVRRYITGRAALIDGDPDRAVELLEEAVVLDPKSAAAWRDLGEAHRAAGSRFASDAAHREAIAADPYERRSLLRLGLEAASRREFDRAIDLLSRIDLEAHPGDPGERYIVWATLGEALIESGALAAGADLMTQGMDLPERFSRPTALADEVERLYRARAGAWSEIGDTLARLDRPASALRAYERASEYPSFDPVGLLARRLYALLALGQPATAANALLGAIGTGESLVLEDQHIELVAYLVRGSSARDGIGRGIESELRRREGELAPARRTALAGRFALARAAALPDQEAADVLSARLAEAPGDLGAIRALLERTGPADPSNLARQVARLIELSPIHERAYTGAALRLAGDPAVLLASLPDPSEGGRALPLLRARLLMSLGRGDEAESTLNDLIVADPGFAPAVSALAELLLSQRRVEEAATVIEALDPNAGEPALIAKARGLASVGRIQDAFALLQEAADAPGASARVAFELGSLYERAGLARPAAERYAQAVALAPQLEESHAALIRLYNQTGPLADRERLFSAVRELREAIPSARTLRWLRAQELAGSGQYGAAERALRELAEEQDDPPVTRALVSVWLATGSSAEAEQWLRERLRARPGDTLLLTQLARSLSAQSRDQEAATLLRDELAQRPGDAELSIQLESLLRERLNRGAEADEFTLRRLENAPPTLASGLQESAVYMRRGAFEPAAGALLRALRQAPGITEDETRAVLAVAQRIGAESQQDAALRAPAAALLDAVFDLGVLLPEGAHRLRLILLTLDDAPVARVQSAVRRAYQDLGSEAEASAGVAAQTLLQRSRPGGAIAVLESAFAATDSVSLPLAGLWLSALVQERHPGEAERFIELLVRRDAAARLARETLGDTTPDLTEASGAAIVAYALAQAWGPADESTGDDPAADLYRVALRFDPAHVMAGNNLGYQLLERGEDLVEAAALIERAYAGDPDSPAVVDSLGWLRYKQGIFTDELDPAGEVELEGAVTILERAARLAIGSNDPGLFELRSHLGDAYWRAGREAEARTQWEAARDAAAILQQNLGERAPAAIAEALAAVEDRLRALEAGEAPRVAPVHGEAAPADDGPPAVR